MFSGLFLGHPVGTDDVVQLVQVRVPAVRVPSGGTCVPVSAVVGAGVS